MKNLIAMVLLLSSMSAFAVETKDCPNTLTVTVSDLYLQKTVEQVLRSARVDTDDLEDSDVIRTAYKRAEKTDEVELRYSNPLRKSGRCIYGYKKSDMQKIELYSTKGKDKLFVQSNLGPRGILLRTYANIEVMTPSYVRLSNEGSLALAIPRSHYTSYTAGGNLVYFGKAKTVRANAR